MWKRTWKSKWARFISRKNGTNWQKLIEYPQNCGRYARREMPKKPTRKHENSSTGITSTVPTNYFNASMDPLSLIYTSPKNDPMTQGGGYSAGPHHHSERPKHKSDRLPKRKSSDDMFSFWLCELFHLYLDLRTGVWGIFSPIWKKSSLSWRISLIIWGMLL